MNGASGRPLRFLVVTTLGWVAMRALLLWPRGDAVPDPPLPLGTRPTAIAAVPALAPPALVSASSSASTPAMVAHPPGIGGGRRMGTAGRSLRPRALPASAGLIAPAPAAPPPGNVATFAGPAPSAVALAPSPPRPPRLWGSGWVFVRGGDAPLAGLTGGQIGGSQAGLRIGYRLGRARRLSVVGRVSSPLRAAGREAALGLDWQPTRLPIHLVAEQRWSLDGGAGGPTVGAIGGFGPRRLPFGVRLEGYAQAGVIARDAGIGFADGALRLDRRFAQLDRAELTLGAGLWGAAQPDAARLDIGPTLAVALPAGHGGVRLSLDWRARIAGDARPGSGIAVTLGTDF